MCGHSSIVEHLGTPGEIEGRDLLAVPIFTVERLTHAEAAPFILAHHYSKTVPTGHNIFFGCYVEGMLYAVADYGRIASRTPPAVILKRDDADHHNTLELRRLCRIGEKRTARFNTSDFLRECHDELGMIGYRYILSYSDQQYNKFVVQFRRAKHKSGGIYKHAGFTHVDETPEEMHVIDANGNRFHRSRAYRKMLSHNIKLCGYRVLDRKRTGNKDRIWPKDLPVATKADKPFPPDKLWELEEVRTWMGFKVEKRMPKDKWLLTL